MSEKDKKQKAKIVAGLLGTILITGNTIPTDIAAIEEIFEEEKSPKRKKGRTKNLQTKLLNSEFNYLQTNNLENLQRSKRQTNEEKSTTLKKQDNEPQPSTTTDSQIDFIEKEITLDENYSKNIKEMIDELIKERHLDPLRMINSEGIVTADRFETLWKIKEIDENIKIIEKLDEILELSKFDKNKIRILILTLKNKNNSEVKLIINLDNFYLQGFINNQNSYFYFKEEQSLAELTRELKDLKTIKEDLEKISWKQEKDLENKCKKINAKKNVWYEQLKKENSKDSRKIKDFIIANDFNKIKNSHTDYQIPTAILNLDKFWGTYKEIEDKKKQITSLLKKVKSSPTKFDKEFKEKIQKQINDYQLESAINEIKSWIENKIYTIEYKKLKENKINEIVSKDKEKTRFKHSCSYQDKGLNAVNQNITISQDTLNKAILNLADYVNKQENSDQNIKDDLARVIFVTSEAIRFGSYIKYFDYEKDGQQVEFKNIPTNVQRILDDKIDSLKWKEYESQLIGGWIEASKYSEQKRKEIFRKLNSVIISNVFLNENETKINKILKEALKDYQKAIEEFNKIIDDSQNNEFKENKDLIIENFKILFDMNKERIKEENVNIERLPVVVSSSNISSSILRNTIITNNLDLVQLLIMKKPEILESKCSNDATPLHFAAMTGRIKSLEILIDKAIEKYGDTNTKEFKEFINSKDNDDATPLHNAANSSDIDKNVIENVKYMDYTEIVKLLLKNGADVNNEIKSTKNTPLHLAVMGVNIDIVKELLNNPNSKDKIDINIPDKDGWTPLHLAVNYDNLCIVTLLIDKAIEKYGDTNTKEFKEFINAKIKDSENNEFTPLHLGAIHLGVRRVNIDIVKDIVKKLIANGADPNIQNENGWTPLHVTAIYNNLKITKELLKHSKIEINKPNKDGKKAIDLCKDEKMKNLLNNYSNFTNKIENLSKLLKKKNLTSENKEKYESQLATNQNQLEELLKFKLSDVITKTELGEVSDNQEQIILNRVKELNPNLDINQVKVQENITDNTATIEQNRNPNDTVNVTFSLTKKIPKPSGTNQTTDTGFGGFKSGFLNPVTKTKPEIINANSQQQKIETNIEQQQPSTSRYKQIKLGLKGGDKVSIQDVDGATSLEFVIDENNQKMFESLIKKGADVNISNNNGDTPLPRTATNVSGSQSQGNTSGTQNNNIKTTNQNNLYDVPADNSCLFWSVSTSYLLQVKNNNEEFKNRFIQLFGEENLKDLEHIQKLLQNYDLGNHRSLEQDWYVDATANNLINAFRNRVVDYMQSNLDNPSNHDNNNLTFRTLIQDDNEIATRYLENMRNSASWGGIPEIVAMSNLLNSNIAVNNNDPYRPVNQTANNNIAIYSVELKKGSGVHNHFNFALSEQPPEVSNTNSQTNIHQEQPKQTITKAEVKRLGARPKGSVVIPDQPVSDNTNIPSIEQSNTNKNSNIPLITAAYNGHTGVVKELLTNQNIKVNEQDKDGNTALFVATFKGYLDIVKLLLDNGANVNTQDVDGLSLLHLAAYNGHTDIVKLLLDNDAEINKKSNLGTTPLYLAKVNGHTEIVKLLENFKGLIDTPSSTNQTTTEKDDHTKELGIPPANTSSVEQVNTNNNSQISIHTKAINQYNSLSKEEKLKRLNEINRYYQSLSENDKKIFNDELTNIGSGVSVLGLTFHGSKMIVSGTSSYSAGGVAANAEAIEMTPLLSTSTTEGLAVTETITVTETAAVEGGIIVGETGAATALAPETLGLSLVIGGLVIAGTWTYFAFHHHSTSEIELPNSIHHNVYDNIEKWYKFLAHDKLKIKINKTTWDEIKENKNSQANLIKIIKNKFVINDHSGWGGSVTNEDFNTFVKVILDHFEQINSYFEILDSENDGFVIVTNTESKWLGIE